mgnify:FL=1
MQKNINKTRHVSARILASSMAYFTFLKKYFKNRAFVFNLRYMERTISKAKVNYLKKTNKSYLEFNHNQLLEELYRVLKSNEELAWLLKRIKRETESV